MPSGSRAIVAPNRRASASVTVCIASTGAARRRAKRSSSNGAPGSVSGPASAQHGGERFGVAEAKVDALPGERVDAVRGDRPTSATRWAIIVGSFCSWSGNPALGVIDSSARARAARSDATRDAKRIAAAGRRLARQRLRARTTPSTSGARAAAARRGCRRRRETIEMRDPRCGCSQLKLATTAVCP